MANPIACKVLNITHHSPKLLSFRIERPQGFQFLAGQFARLGFMQGEEYISRAYSMISAESDNFLDFYAILIENGVMSQHFAKMQQGDSLLLEPNAVGFFTAERVPQGKGLIMLATGTGIAPFLSMMSSPIFWQKADKIFLVHSVSYAADLIFPHYLQKLQETPALAPYLEKLHYQPVVTREKMAGALQQRIPDLLQQGELASALQVPFNKADTRFLICGNPAMVKSTYETLKFQGFALHRVRQAGEIMMENAF